MKTRFKDYAVRKQDFLGDEDKYKKVLQLVPDENILSLEGLLSPAYEIGRGILKWRCPSVLPSFRPSVLPSVLPSVRHLRFLSN